MTGSQSGLRPHAPPLSLLANGPGGLSLAVVSLYLYRVTPL